MSLKDQGFAFCISPNRKQGRWLHPVERKQLYADWTDVTDWPTENWSPSSPPRQSRPSPSQPESTHHWLAFLRGPDGMQKTGSRAG